MSLIVRSPSPTGATDAVGCLAVTRSAPGVAEVEKVCVTVIGSLVLD
jgi:hypothetical protein